MYKRDQQTQAGAKGAGWLTDHFNRKTNKRTRALAHLLTHHLKGPKGFAVPAQQVYQLGNDHL